MFISTKRAAHWWPILFILAALRCWLSLAGERGWERERGHCYFVRNGAKRDESFTVSTRCPFNLSLLIFASHSFVGPVSSLVWISHRLPYTPEPFRTGPLPWPSSSSSSLLSFRAVNWWAKQKKRHAPMSWRPARSLSHLLVFCASPCQLAHLPQRT